MHTIRRYFRNAKETRAAAVPRFPGPGTLLLTLLCTTAALAQSNAAPAWTATWGSAQMAPYEAAALTPAALTGATLRQVVHLSAGGTGIELKLSNAFGTTPLQLRSVHVARRGTAPGTIDPATDTPVLFAGHAATSIPPGAEYMSDPIAFAVAPLSDVVVTLEIDTAPAVLTTHAGARATGFVAAGAHATETALPSPQTMLAWYFLAGIDVTGNRTAQGSVVALGDSITDGHGSTTDGNDRWPDVLAARLAKDGRHTLGVVNEGIGGNRILLNGLGPNAAARFERDVLVQPGLHSLIVMEGINDIGGLDRTEAHPAAVHDALLENLETALAEMAQQAHRRGVRVLGATLTPFIGSDYYHPSAASEADRVHLNQWIRTSHTFDAVVDFDEALRDPAHPDRLLPLYDSGDHLHPGPKGYERMGQAVSLTQLF